ncbi:MAG: 4Fe-4S dicluster domain-containing protein [Gammaproteobacteria bacterium]|nr:4Fe-4S dicluster domain-containing protein [Gammaproteobacteria bacterium]
MLFRDRAHLRGVEAGPYPLESLTTDASVNPFVGAVIPQHTAAIKVDTPLATAVRKYANILAQCSNSPPAQRAEINADLVARTREIKGAAYYLDAAQTGICEIPQKAWLQQQQPLTHAIVILVEFGRSIEANNLAQQWLRGAEYDVAQMRALEIGVSIMGHVRALGFNAQCHYPEHTQLHLDGLAILAGVTQATTGLNPFIGDRYAQLVIATDYVLATDTPLAHNTRVNPIRHYFGINGARSGREVQRRRQRASHMSRYPMEQVTRVNKPTTAIFADEIPRVPKRAEFFQRARMGDLGAKAQQEVKRFAFKHPLTDGMMHPLRALVPHQDGEVNSALAPGFSDASANTQAIKSLSYHLGADLTGICEIPDFAWYSHGPDGKEIPIRHKYAVVMLIDQGYDTMEGASGDDWISGCQSMRGYIRGAEIAGIMAEFLRSQGVDSRPQTNADSHVLHIPLVLLAGLGELSRIGELVLNPYVGPRFKSVVLSTNLPLIVDQPIDFGLQDFCGRCLKCARECPVNAISFGEKIIFNGYEIWKPDVERCTRYRVTNPKGSACGRCMKTCPLNKVVTADGALVHRLGTWLGVNVRWLKPLLVPLAVYLDDKLGYGKRNPIKRWWMDLEIVDGVVHTPKGTNERDLNLQASTSGAKSPVGYYHAKDMPAPDATKPVPINHKDAVARARIVETLSQAKHRRAQGGTTPAHYIPTKTLPSAEE